MRRIGRREWLALVAFLIVPGLGFSQSGQQAGTLVVTGHSGQAPVTHLDGRPYVAVDALARLMNGSLGYRGNEITLTVHGTAVATATEPDNRSLSRDFLNAGIEAVSDTREWRSALLVAVEHGYKVSDAGVDGFRAQAIKNYQRASVAATTDSDRNALALLNRNLAHMQQLHDKVVAARNRLSYINVDFLTKDPLDQKILGCSHFLGEMAVSGEFQDNGSCR
jgi:hypothetical protein